MPCSEHRRGERQNLCSLKACQASWKPSGTFSTKAHALQNFSASSSHVWVDQPVPHGGISQFFVQQSDSDDQNKSYGQSLDSLCAVWWQHTRSPGGGYTNAEKVWSHAFARHTGLEQPKWHPYSCSSQMDETAWLGGNCGLALETGVTFNSLTLSASKEMDLQAHQIRQVWRQSLLTKWSLGKRHEAQQMQRRYSPLQMRQQLLHVDLNQARRVLETATAKGRAIMLGSNVSPAMFHKMKPTESAHCQWCSCRFATFEHLAWLCRGIPRASERPFRPSNYLSWRFLLGQVWSFRGSNISPCLTG